MNFPQDPAVTNNATNYEPWDWLNDNDTYVKWKNGTAMMGYVWPAGDTGFPDFFLDRTKKVWKDLIKKHAEWIGFDGVWIVSFLPLLFQLFSIKII